VHLDRPDANPEIVGNFLVGLTVDEPVQNLLLTRAQSGNLLRSVGYFAGSVSEHVCCERAFYCLDQALVVERFFDEIECAAFDRLDGCRNVALSSYHDNGQINAVRNEPAMQLKSINVWHAQIE
jgi:hypothetical protein